MISEGGGFSWDTVKGCGSLLATSEGCGFSWDEVQGDESSWITVDVPGSSRIEHRGRGCFRATTW